MIARTGRRALLLSAPGLLAEPACAQEFPTHFRLPTPARPGLVPLGGMVLDTAAWGFGGFSALHMGPDLTLSAISDRGRWWQARLVLDAAGQPRALEEVRHGPLRDATGLPLRGRMGDAESLVRLSNGWLVGFERQHRLQRHSALDAPGQPFPAPPGLAAAPDNGGLEALALLADGRLLALSESLPPPGETAALRAAWLGTIEGGRPRWAATSYRPQLDMDPTDAAGLPEGGALVLERSYSLFGGFRCRLARVSPAALASTPIAGDTLLELPGDAPAENWEGVAVARHRGATLVALISDDNERRVQRSLLLLYRLA